MEYVPKFDPNDRFKWVFPKIVNSVTPKSSILIGFSIINHPFWDTPIFGNTQIYHIWSIWENPLKLNLNHLEIIPSEWAIEGDRMSKSGNFKWGQQTRREVCGKVDSLIPGGSEILLTSWYCWWKKSCTTLDVWNLVKNERNYLSAGAGFLAPTVWQTSQISTVGPEPIVTNGVTWGPLWMAEHKWVTRVSTTINGAITLLLSGLGPPLIYGGFKSTSECSSTPTVRPQKQVSFTFMSCEITITQKSSPK